MHLEPLLEPLLLELEHLLPLAAEGRLGGHGLHGACNLLQLRTREHARLTKGRSLGWETPPPLLKSVRQQRHRRLYMQRHNKRRLESRTRMAMMREAEGERREGEGHDRTDRRGAWD
eukprot:1650334-Pleurochrysis_carterae.AAC.3